MLTLNTVLMTVTNKSTSAYVYTVLNISDRDLMFSPNSECNDTAFNLFFEIRIMHERLYFIKKDYAGCSLPYITKHAAEA